MGKHSRNQWRNTGGNPNPFRPPTAPARDTYVRYPDGKYYYIDIETGRVVNITEDDTYTTKNQRKYMRLPLDTLSIEDHGNDLNFMKDYLYDRFILAEEGYVTYPRMSWIGEDEERILRLNMMTSTMKYGAPMTGMQVNLNPAIRSGQTRVDLWQYRSLSHKVMKEYTIHDNMYASMTDRVLITFPRLYSNENTKKWKVGNMVYCPVADMEAAKRQRYKFCPVFEKVHDELYEVLIHSNPSKILRIYPKVKKALLRTHDGDLVYPLGLLAEELDFIPYL